MHLHSCFSKEYFVSPDSWGKKDLLHERVVKWMQAIATRKSKYHALKWVLYYKSGFAPKEVYDRVIKNGMDFFCLTDHDTIEGWQQLIKEYPKTWSKVITGVELTTRIPRRNF